MGKTQIGEFGEDEGLLLGIAVEHPQHPRAVRHSSKVEINGAGGGDPDGGLAQRILIHGQDFVVAQQRIGERIEVLQITAEQQRRRQQAPQGEMRPLFLG